LFMAKLRGGRKTVKAKVKRKKFLGKGFEGKVFEAEVTVKKKGKERTVTLAEKKFKRTRYKEKYARQKKKHPSFRDPKKHFATYQELKQLNQEKGLGLRLPRTVRLRKRLLRKSTLVMSKIEIARFEDFKGRDLKNFIKDTKRQVEALKNYDYGIGPDSFFPVRGKNGKITAVIGDFGTIRKIKKK